LLIFLEGRDKPGHDGPAYGGRSRAAIQASAR
jgi:hypothetical protein